jgi:hypothetical protein
VTKLVLDANALRRGHFNAASLRQWVDAAGGGDVDILIPEVVLWEWAEHAASAHATLHAQHQEFKVDPAVYDRPTLTEEVSKETLVTRITALLPQSVTLWVPPASAWERAVMEQVLQIGTGERRDSVKTGAADSLVLACVQEQVDERRGTEAVLLATNDKRLQKACSTRFGDDVLLAGSTADLLNRINSFEPARGDLQEEVEEVLRRLLPDARSEIGAALDTFEMGFEIQPGRAPAASSRRHTAHRELARLGRVEIVELHELLVTKQDGNDRVGLADVRLFADVHITALELRETETHVSEWVSTFDGVVTGGYIDLQLSVSFDRHWSVQSVASAGAATIVFEGPEDEEESDVFET